VDDPSLQMTIGLVGVAAAYVVLAVLLLSVNVASRWLWWIKSVAIVVTALFFVQSYSSVAGLIGWPTNDRLPDRFEFLWATVAEPNKFFDVPGAVFIWVDAFGADDAPNGTPRAYRVPYSRALSDQIAAAEALVREGKAVAGYARPLPMVAAAAAGDTRDLGQQRINELRPANFTENAVEVLLEEMQPTGRQPPAR